VLFLMEEWPEGLLEGTNRMALRPSRSAVELMLKSCGFTDVQVKPPRRPLDHSYFVGKRAVFTARACAEGERADLSYQLRDQETHYETWSGNHWAGHHGQAYG